MTIQNIWDDQLAGTETSDPSIGFLLRNLVNHQFSFQYIRLVRTSSGGPHNPENDAGVIEIAWMTAPTAQEATGTRAFCGPGDENIFFVLHLHFDHFVRSQDASRDYIPAVYAMTAFHGQVVDQTARNDVLGQLAGHLNNRIDGYDKGSGGANERVRILGDHGVVYNFIGALQSHWLPGTDEYRPTGNGGRDTFFRLVHDLGHHLRSEGYIQADRLHRVWGEDENEGAETMELSWRTYITSGDSGSFVLNGSPWQPPAGVPSYS